MQKVFTRIAAVTAGHEHYGLAAVLAKLDHTGSFVVEQQPYRCIGVALEFNQYLPAAENIIKGQRCSRQDPTGKRTVFRRRKVPELDRIFYQ